MAQGDKKKKSNGGGEGAAKAAREASKAEEKGGSAKPAGEGAKKAAGGEAAKKGAGEGAKKAAGSEAAKKHAPDEHAVEAKAARAPHEPEEKHGAAHGHGHKPDRREYFVIFGVLFVLTVLEVVIAQIPGLSKVLLGTALVGLALAKAACVGLFYMHLKHETRILRVGVAIPLAAPALYAFVLIAEAAWRLTR
jgi:caa(3)-type oxidase subunit IV